MDKVNSSQFDTLIGGSKPVVCDFFATWCGPCKMLGPVIEQVAADHADKAVFVKVDVDECPDLAARYGIMSIPFVAVFRRNGHACCLPFRPGILFPRHAPSSGSGGSVPIS